VRGVVTHASETSPLVSIITVVLNGAPYVSRAIESVVYQSYNAVEFIVIDGGSTDGTLDILRAYDQAIDYWVSEPDSGIYDAMNKGVSVARGNWVLFLGADDVLAHRHILEHVFCRTPIPADTDILFGNVWYVAGWLYKRGRLFRGRFGPEIKFRNTLHHQGTFYARRLFQDFQYETGFVVSSDYELNLRLFVSGARWRQFDEVVAWCGISESVLAVWGAYTAEIKIRHRYLSLRESFWYDVQTIARFLVKSVLLRLK
jgi:glycosyltransferase involved in cell wall biosynthesis